MKVNQNSDCNLTQKGESKTDKKQMQIYIKKLYTLRSYTLFTRNHFIRNVHKEGKKNQGTFTTKDKIPKELFSFGYCYDWSQLSIREPVQFIAVKCFIEGFPLQLTLSIVSYLNTFAISKALNVQLKVRK